MFGGRRRHYGGGRRGGGLGLILMAMQFFQFFNFLSQSDRFFPITLAVMAVNVIAYLRPAGLNIIVWPSLQQACISLRTVWFQREWKRIFTSPFIHSHDYHLYYNMASFMWKAVSLERQFGSSYFLYMVSVFSVVTSLVYLGIQYILNEVMDGMFRSDSCAVGFSGVIFALKVVTTHMQPNGRAMIMGLFPVPTRLACWAELVVISVLFPNVSFVGHLSGILVGLAFVTGPLKSLMDIPVAMLENNRGFDPFPHGDGDGGSYTYRASATGYRAPPAQETDNVNNDRGTRHPPLHHTSYTYAARTTGHVSRNDGGGRTGSEMEEEELQEAIRMSLQDHQSGSGEDSTLDRDYSPTPSAPPPPPPPHLTTASTDSLVHDQTPVTSQPSYPGHRTASDDNGGLEERGDDRALLPLREYREAPEDRTLRRRHVVEDRSEGEQSDRRGREQSDNNMRAARLKRFGKNKNN